MWMAKFLLNHIITKVEKTYFIHCTLVCKNNSTKQQHNGLDLNEVQVSNNMKLGLDHSFFE
jgi:hypothetical protein